MKRAVLPAVIAAGLFLTGCGSDDASTITFSRYDGTTGNIQAMNPDGTNERQVTSAAGVLAHSTLTPDGGTVVYS